jgi:hypothetical protein
MGLRHHFDPQPNYTEFSLYQELLSEAFLSLP